jgi:hypothetical protein
VKNLLLMLAVTVAVSAVMTGPAAMLIPWLERQHMSGLVTPLVLLLLLLGWLLTGVLVRTPKRPRSR